jgi:hypothetical protein
MTQVVDRPAGHGTAPRASRLYARLDSLFPIAPLTRLSWRGVTIAGAAVVAGTLLGLARVPGVGSLDTVWAEDGEIFLNERMHLGFRHALVTSYAGYYHLVPRLLAAVTAALPPGWAAAAFAIEASLVTALLAVFVYVASAAHLRSRLARVLVAAVAVLVPAAGEISDSIANFHWVGLYAVFWALLWVPRRWVGRVVAIAVVLLVAGSDILVVVFLPLAALRLVRRRDAQSLLLAGGLVLGVAVQFAGLLSGSSSRPLKGGGPGQVAYGYARHVIPDTLFGERTAGVAWRGAHWPLITLLGLLALGLVVLVGWRSKSANWWLAGIAACYSAALLAAPVLLASFTARYAAVPVMLLTVAVVAVLQERIPHYVITVLFLLVWSVNLRVVDNSRHAGPRWSDTLRQAQATCQQEGVTWVSVPIAPAEAPQPRHAVLPCWYLQR